MVFPLPPVQEYEGVQAAVQEAAAYEPERVPFEQERDCEMEAQVTPSGATADWYAVTLLPWETAEPPKVQSWLQDWYWKLPERLPLEQVRVCELQVEPYGTVLAWYAVTLPPCATVLPHGAVQLEGAEEVRV